MNTTAKDSKALEHIHRDDAIARLQHYFGTVAGSVPDPGASFETIGHSWDSKSSVNTVTPSDLLALATLSATVSGPAAVWMLDRRNLKKTEKLLKKIPVNAKIGTKKGDKLLQEGGAAAKLWNHWMQAPGFGPVATSKLLARKRAKLVPAYGAVIADQLAISGPHEHWSEMQRLFAEDVHLWETAKQWRRTAGVSSLVSPLRVLDVVLWHRGTYPDGPPSTE